MLYQLLSLVGAVLILAGFALLQMGRLDRTDRLFNLLNFVGSALLTVVAVEDRRLGFIFLEGAWALLSLVPLLRPPRRAA
ncbi:MAG: hypothetical protein HOQ09_13640 [Gemmatimonadaceae bacterium]|nr:hypothetical protein [Gemmatimonadaceae bacterium]